MTGEDGEITPNKRMVLKGTSKLNTDNHIITFSFCYFCKKFENNLNIRKEEKPDEQLHSMGLIVNEGKIIDSIFVVIPIQMSSRKENKMIKDCEGNVPHRIHESCLLYADYFR